MATEAELAAQAEGGQAGLDAFRRAQSEITDRSKESVAAALAEASQRGAVGTPQSQAIQSIITAPVNRRLDDLSQASATFEADMARLNAAQGDYMGGVSRFGPGNVGGGSGGGRGGSDSDNRYGGYGSAGEYENAVTAGAQLRRDEAYGQALADRRGGGTQEALRQAESFTGRGIRDWVESQAPSKEKGVRPRDAIDAGRQLASLIAQRERARQMDMSRQAIANRDPNHAFTETYTRAEREAYNRRRAEELRMGQAYTLRGIQEYGETLPITGAANLASTGLLGTQFATPVEPYQSTNAMAAGSEQLALAIAQAQAARSGYMAPFEDAIGIDRTYVDAIDQLINPNVRPDQRTGGTIMDPNNFYEFQRAFAINELGADPLDAMGRFGPMSEQDLLEQNEEALALQLAQQQNRTDAFAEQDATLRSQVVANAFGRDIEDIASDAGVTSDVIVGLALDEGFVADVQAVLSGQVTPTEAVTAYMEPEEGEPDPALARLLLAIVSPLIGLDEDINELLRGY